LELVFLTIGIDQVLDLRKNFEYLPIFIKKDLLILVARVQIRLGNR